MNTPYLCTYHLTNSKPKFSLGILIEGREVQASGHILIHKLKFLSISKKPYQNSSSIFENLAEIGVHEQLQFSTCSIAKRNEREGKERKATWTHLVREKKKVIA